MYHIHAKREHDRISVNFPVGIELPYQKRTEAIAVNIGKGGMLLNCDSCKNFNKLDDVNLYFPTSHNQNSFTIAAKITRIQGNKIGLFFYSDPSEYLSENMS